MTESVLKDGSLKEIAIFEGGRQIPLANPDIKVVESKFSSFNRFKIGFSIVYYQKFPL